MKDTQRNELPHLVAIRHERQSDAVVLDAATRRNLEIDKNVHGNEDNTLFSVYNSTVTAMGTRHLKRWLHRPVRIRDELEARLEAVEALKSNYNYEGTRQHLKPISDMERILARVALRSARPRDLTRLRDSLWALPALVSAVALASAKLDTLVADISDYPTLRELLSKALIESTPLSLETAVSSPQAMMTNSTNCAVSATTPGSISSISSDASEKRLVSPPLRSVTTAFTATTSKSAASNQIRRLIPTSVDRHSRT